LSLLSHQPRFKLDFIEIGTSDYGTCLQYADNEYKKNESAKSSSPYLGISIEAMSSYLNRLPTVPHVLKLNAAVTPFNLSAHHYELNHRLSWNPMYSLPDYFLSP